MTDPNSINYSSAGSNGSNIVRAMQNALGSLEVIPESDISERYLRDWVLDHRGQARALVRPASVDEVRSVVAYCSANKIPLLPQGGNTGLVCGALSESPGFVLLSLERLNRVRSVDSQNFSITVDAGCILRAVKDAAEESDLSFPLSLGAEGSCQIGGNIATNAGGINVLRYGMMRDLVLGLEVVLPDGSLWQRLDNLRKDNRGYDLKQLFIGSEGTLGIVTGGSLKLFPKPDRVETAFVGVDSFESAISLFSAARHACSDLLTGFEIIGNECLSLATFADPDIRNPLEDQFPVYILMEVSASRYIDVRNVLERFLADAMEHGTVMDAALADSLDQAASFWRIRSGLVEGQVKRGFHIRSDSSVQLPQIPALIQRLREMVAEEYPGWISQAYGHVGDGNVHFNAMPPEDLDDQRAREIGVGVENRIYDIVDTFGGSISAEHGLGRTKRDMFAATADDVHLDMMRGLKRMLDPGGVMNPGCMLDQERFD